MLKSPQATLRVIFTLSLIAAFGLGCAQMDTRGLVGGGGALGAKSEKSDDAGKTDDSGIPGTLGSGGQGSTSSSSPGDNTPQDFPGKKKDIQVAQNGKPQEIFGSQVDPGNLGHGDAMVLGVPPYDPKGGQCPSEVVIRIFDWPDVSPDKMPEEQTWDYIKDVRAKVISKTVTWDDFKGSYWREMKLPMQLQQTDCVLVTTDLDASMAKLKDVSLMFWRPSNTIPLVTTQPLTPEEFQAFFPTQAPSLKDKKTPPENY